MAHGRCRDVGGSCYSRYFALRRLQILIWAEVRTPLSFDTGIRPTHSLQGFVDLLDDGLSIMNNDTICNVA